MQWSLWHDISAIGLFQYLTKWWYREYGGHLNACPGRLEGKQKLVQGGWNKTQACPGGGIK